MDTDTLRGLCAKTPTEKTAIFGGETLRDSCALALRDIKSVKLKRVNVVGMALLIGVPVAAWLIILHSVGP